jgi:hypothetical protein
MEIDPSFRTPGRSCPRNETHTVYIDHRDDRFAVLILAMPMTDFGRDCVKTLEVQFELFILATYVRFRMNYCARVERYLTYGLSRLSFYTASADAGHRDSYRHGNSRTVLVFGC